MTDVCCYVCEKDNAKRCTRCLQIAYCGIDCQKKDWKYHKNTCKKTPTNIVDMLLRSHNYQDLSSPIFQNIFRYLSGKDLHNFRIVCRSWREVMIATASMKTIKTEWMKKLTLQWKIGAPDIKTVSFENMEISQMAVSKDELFVDVFRQPVIKVYDISTLNYKHSLRTSDRKQVK